jgi:protocatechuate 3,4-dioxygenase beta subunit
VSFAAGIVLALVAAAAQQAPSPPRPSPSIPPRDIAGRRPEPAGTGVIRGRVVAADTGSPIRRANVNLLAVPPSTPVGARTPPGSGASPSAVLTPPRPAVPVPSSSNSRLGITDAQGGFEFSGLPAGSYRIMVSPGQYSAQYVAMAYGATRPSGPFMSVPGTVIQLSEGQTLDKAVIALPRGAVISGRVTDDNAEPLARVQVYTLFFPPGSLRGQRFGAGGQTDDLGQFRLYGLNPGDYVVAAEARGMNFEPPNARPQTEEETIGFITTYYPGVTDDAGAQRVRARVGTETSGIEIRMVQGRLFRVAGLVVDSQGRPTARTNLQISTRMAGNSGTSFGASTDEQGRFQMRSLPPGSYRITVRQMRPDVGPRGPNGQPEPGEMATVQLTVASDIENLMIATGPGSTVTGHLVFEQGPPSPLPPQLRVTSVVGNPEDGPFMPSSDATVAPDLSFTLKGLMGESLLRTFVPNQYVKSVTVNNEDITDTPREFRNSDRIVITLTSRMSTIEGNVTDARGASVADAGIVVFSEDKGSWRTNSIRSKRGGTDASGHFRISGLMPGRYFVAAASRERINVPSMVAGPEYFEQLAKEATAVVLGEDEQRTINVTLMEGSGQ